jgi:hypothetical protein
MAKERLAAAVLTPSAICVIYGGLTGNPDLDLATEDRRA